MRYNMALLRKRCYKMSVYAVAKKDSYVMTSEESSSVFVTKRDKAKMNKIESDARRFEESCLSKGTQMLESKKVRK